VSGTLFEVVDSVLGSNPVVKMVVDTAAQSGALTQLLPAASTLLTVAADLASTVLPAAGSIMAGNGGAFINVINDTVSSKLGIDAGGIFTANLGGWTPVFAGAMDTGIMKNIQASFEQVAGVATLKKMVVDGVQSAINIPSTDVVGAFTKKIQTELTSVVEPAMDLYQGGMSVYDGLTI